MSLTAFLDSATTMLFEEFQRVGLGAFEAFDRVREWAAGQHRLVTGQPVTREAEPPVERVPSASENDRSMQQFTALLGGLGGMPG